MWRLTVTDPVVHSPPLHGRVRIADPPARPPELQHHSQHKPRKPDKFASVARFVLHTVDVGPQDLPGQLPLRATIVGRLTGIDRDDYWCAHLDAPLKYHLPAGFDRRRTASTALSDDQDGPLLWVEHLVVCSRQSGTRLRSGMTNLAVNIAYVVDPSLCNEDRLDMRKIDYVAVGEIDDSPASDIEDVAPPPITAADHESSARAPDTSPSSGPIATDMSEVSPGALADSETESEVSPGALADSETGSEASPDVTPQPDPVVEASSNTPPIPESASTGSDAIISDTDFMNLRDEWVGRLTAVAGEKPRYVPEPVGSHATGVFYRIEANELSYQAVRNGEIVWVRKTVEPYELLYWIVSDVASAIARSRNREPSVGRYRPPWVVDWHALMNSLSPQWALRTQARIDAMTQDEWRRRRPT
ncbi:MAG: hypothetical protein QOH60_1531 [Mycobacterium sp.]|nr:hypothetical protein [Mycobacterium sp.]